MRNNNKTQNKVILQVEGRLKIYWELLPLIDIGVNEDEI